MPIVGGSRTVIGGAGGKGAVVQPSGKPVTGGVTTGQLADGVLSADATGRAKMAAAFYGAGVAASQAHFQDGFWTADAAGRAKFADGIFTYAKLNVAGAILNADIAAGAAIAYSKLALAGAILGADLAFVPDNLHTRGQALGTAEGTTAISFGTPRYLPVGGAANPDTTEANVQGTVQRAGTIKAWSALVGANAAGGNCTAELRVNGATVSTLTWAAAETGAKNSGVVSLAVAAGDVLSIKLTCGTSGTFKVTCADASILWS